MQTLLFALVRVSSSWTLLLPSFSRAEAATSHTFQTITTWNSPGKVKSSTFLCGKKSLRCFAESALILCDSYIRRTETATLWCLCWGVQSPPFLRSFYWNWTEMSSSQSIEMTHGLIETTPMEAPKRRSFELRTALWSTGEAFCRRIRNISTFDPPLSIWSSAEEEVRGWRCSRTAIFRKLRVMLVRCLGTELFWRLYFSPLHVWNCYRWKCGLFVSIYSISIDGVKWLLRFMSAHEL